MRNIANDSAWFPICSLLEVRAWSRVNARAKLHCQNTELANVLCTNKANHKGGSPLYLLFYIPTPLDYRMSMPMHMYRPLMHIYPGSHLVTESLSLTLT